MENIRKSLQILSTHGVAKTGHTAALAIVEVCHLLRDQLMIRPTIWIVLEVSGDGYHLWDKEPVAWFFDEKEAEEWAALQPNHHHLEVVECPGEKSNG